MQSFYTYAGFRLHQDVLCLVWQLLTRADRLEFQQWYQRLSVDSFEPPAGPPASAVAGSADVVTVEDDPMLPAEMPTESASSSHAPRPTRRLDPPLP